jgi:hypothetical protein
VEALRDATREQVEAFVVHLADWAEKDRNALFCQLNSYLGQKLRCRMKRQITGLHAADRCAADQIPVGVFLVRVQRVRFQRQAQKTYFTLSLAILEPVRFSGHILSSRLYCSPKALWLNWFLRDFG